MVQQKVSDPKTITMERPRRSKRGVVSDMSISEPSPAASVVKPLIVVVVKASPTAMQSVAVLLYPPYVLMVAV